jgi:hypothetical protein
MVTAGLGLVILAGAGQDLDLALLRIWPTWTGKPCKGFDGYGRVADGSGALQQASQKPTRAGIAQGAGILLLAAGIKILASAIADMGNLQWEQIGKGLADHGWRSYRYRTRSESDAAVNASFGSGSSGRGCISRDDRRCLGQMGGMDWENIAKGLVAMGGALTIIAIATNTMTGALPGAAAMLVVAASLGLSCLPCCKALERWTGRTSRRPWWCSPVP